MKVNANLTKVLKKIHEEKWVALSRGQRKVIDFDADLLELRERLGKKRNNYTYMRVLRSDMEYCFSFSWEND